MLLALGLLTVAVWAVLLGGRGGFWTARARDGGERLDPAADWPEVVAVVPARDEADVIGQSLRSLLTQTYPGRLSVVLVDDQSSDGTARVARAAAQALGADEQLQIVQGTTPPPGWTGSGASVASRTSA